MKLSNVGGFALTRLRVLVGILLVLLVGIGELAIPAPAFASVSITPPAIQGFTSLPSSWWELNLPNEFRVYPGSTPPVVSVQPVSTTSYYPTAVPAYTEVPHTTTTWVTSGYNQPHTTWVTSGYNQPHTSWVTSGYNQPYTYWVTSGYNRPYTAWVSGYNTTYTYWVNGYSYKGAQQCSTYSGRYNRFYQRCWIPVVHVQGHWATGLRWVSGHWGTAYTYVNTSHLATGYRWVNTSHPVTTYTYVNTSHYVTTYTYVNTSHYVYTTTYVNTLTGWRTVMVPVVTTTTQTGVSVGGVTLNGVTPAIQDVTQGAYDGLEVSGPFCSGAQHALVSPSSPSFPDYSGTEWKYTGYFGSLGICTFNPSYVPGNTVQSWWASGNEARLILTPQWTITVSYTQVMTRNGVVISSTPQTQTQTVWGSPYYGQPWKIRAITAVSCSQVNGYLLCPGKTAVPVP